MIVANPGTSHGPPLDNNGDGDGYALPLDSYLPPGDYLPAPMDNNGSEGVDIQKLSRCLPGVDGARRVPLRMRKLPPNMSEETKKELLLPLAGEHQHATSQLF